LGVRGWAGVARLGGVGDDLVAASVLRPLKRQGYKTDMITSPPNHVLFHNNPFVDKLSVKKEGDLPQGDMGAWQKWFASRAAEYEVFANLSHSMEVRHAFFPHQTEFWWPVEYRRKIAAGSYLETVHDICGMPHEFGPLYFPTEEERDRAAKTKKEQMGLRTVAWVIAGSRIDKIYPYSAMVIARIIKELDVHVMIVGAPHERQWTAAKSIEEHVTRQNGSLAGFHVAMTVTGSPAGGAKDWPLRRSLAQLQTCDLVVTPDTGAAWSVAFEEMPKVVMVSHASAENITKHWRNTVTLAADQTRVPCSPCHRLHSDPSTCVPAKDMGKETGAAACMADISADRVMTAVRNALAS
jgi:ADP-heptose:LPS heptosyltransferase